MVRPRTFCNDARGIALIEFVIVLPVILLLFFGSIEVTHYLLAILNVQKSAYVLTDIIAQYSPATKARASGELNETELQTVLNQYSTLVGGNSNQHVAIMSLIQRTSPGATPVIRWQESGGGTLSAGVTSVVTGQGPCGHCAPGMGNARLPAQYDVSLMRNQETMLVGEVYYRYEPFLNAILAPLGLDFPPRTISRVLFALPRNGPLVCLPETFVYSDCS